MIHMPQSRLQTLLPALLTSSMPKKTGFDKHIVPHDCLSDVLFTGNYMLMSCPTQGAAPHTLTKACPAASLTCQSIRPLTTVLFLLRAACHPSTPWFFLSPPFCCTKGLHVQICHPPLQPLPWHLCCHEKWTKA